jgi:hypothetical protein
MNMEYEQRPSSLIKPKRSIIVSGFAACGEDDKTSKRQNVKTSKRQNCQNCQNTASRFWRGGGTVLNTTS